MSRRKSLRSDPAVSDPAATAFVQRMTEARARLEILRSDQPGDYGEALAQAAAKGIVPDHVAKAAQKLARRKAYGEKLDLADARRERVACMSREGVPVAAIAAELGLSRYYVVELRRELGVAKRRPKR